MVVLSGDSSPDQCGTLHSVKTKGPTVPYGAKVVQGPRELLEDAFSVASVPQPNQAPSSPGPYYAQVQTDAELSYFGVFDGHGGVEAANHAASRLHEHLKEALAQEARSATVSTDSICSQSSAAACADALLAQELSTSSTELPDSDIVEPLPELPTPGWAGAVRAMAPLNDRYNHSVRKALQAAFIRTDADLAGTEIGEVVGTTAVVAVVGRTEVLVGHCGDSRAVLCRKGVAVPLTSDHKPDRHDERARVSSLGGRIIYKGGSQRVMGLLAMTRAIGDHLMRPYVIPDPEVTSFQRTYDDELLLLASDGLWDVFSCQEATTLALRSTMRARERGASASAACRIGASVLARGALERGSKDNITVVVVDLRLRHHESPAGSVAAVLASQCSDMPFSACPYNRRKRSSSGNDSLPDETANASCPGASEAVAGASPAAVGQGWWSSSNGGLARSGSKPHTPQPPRQQSHMEAVVSTWAAAAALFSGPSFSKGNSRRDTDGWSTISTSGAAAAATQASGVGGATSSAHGNHPRRQQQQRLPSTQSAPMQHVPASPAALHHPAAAAAAAAAVPASAPATAASSPRSQYSTCRSQSFSTSTLHTWRAPAEQHYNSSSSNNRSSDSDNSDNSDSRAVITSCPGSTPSQAAAAVSGKGAAVLQMGIKVGAAAAAALDNFGSVSLGTEKPPLPVRR